MIAKISTGASMYGALAYNEEKVTRNTACVLAWNRIMEPPDGVPGIGHCMRSFNPYLAANKRTEKPVMHISLNPSPEDNLSDEQLEAIARDYLQKLGYGNQPYIIYKHEDIARPHLHIVTTCVTERGSKINDYQIWKRSQAICRLLEKKYGLHSAEKKDYACQQGLSSVNYKDSDLKNKIANVVKGVLRQYRFQSLREFKAVLNLFNVTMEEVRGQAAGKPYQGLVYAATDEQGKRVGVGVNSSKIGRDVGLKALSRRIGLNKGWMKKHPPRPELKRSISDALHAAPTETEFIRILKAKNIDAVIWKNDTGHIYGMTYIDHTSKCVYKGSALGKECSAGVVNREYNAEEYENQPSLWSQDDQHSAADGMSLSESLFDLFTFESYPHPFLEDPEQQNPYGRKKKKRKKKGGQHL